MNVIVITGSPHRSGTTDYLAQEYIRGAEEAGHKVYRFDAAHERVSPCNACDRCGMGNGACVLGDAMEKLYPELISADVVVFVTPVYYFGMTAQLKTVIDRFYGINFKLHGSGKKAYLVSACQDTNAGSAHALTAHYETLIRYFGWKNEGILFAAGCGGRVDLERTEHPKKAYEMGKGIE